MIPGESRVKAFLRRLDAGRMKPMLIYKYQPSKSGAKRFDGLDDEGDIKVETPKGSLNGKKGPKPHSSSGDVKGKKKE